MSETGVIGFAAFVLFVGFGLHHVRKQARQAAQPGLAHLSTGIEIAIWGFLVCGMSGGYVLTWFPYILVGLAVAAKRLGEESQ
jgi:hypothetical protein